MIMVERDIAAEWELSEIANYYSRKEDALVRWSYRGLKLTDKILNMVKPGCGTTDATGVILNIILAKINNGWNRFRKFLLLICKQLS